MLFVVLRSQPGFLAVVCRGDIRSVRSLCFDRLVDHMRDSSAGAAPVASLPPDFQTPPQRRPRTWPEMKTQSSQGTPSHVDGVALAAASAYEQGQHSRRVGPYTYPYGGYRTWHQRWNQIGSSNSWRRIPDKERPLKPQRRFDDHRYWLHAPEPTSCREKFVLLSYNILSADNAKDHWHELYNHIPYYVIEWSRRKRKLLQEFGLWSPDIICLQEVDRYEDLVEELEAKGYSGLFKARTGKATDGCAIFWRTKRFRLKHYEGIEFRDFDLRDNVAQLCLLQAIVNVDPENVNGSSDAQKSRGDKIETEGDLVVVGNIHVLFNPKRGDIKLGQVRVLTERAGSLSKQFGGAPVVVAGDFNSTPSSPLYHFLANSQLDVSSQDRRRISGQVDVEGASHFKWRNPFVATVAGRTLEKPQPKPVEGVEPQSVEQGDASMTEVEYEKVVLGSVTNVDSKGLSSSETWEYDVRISYAKQSNGKDVQVGSVSQSHEEKDFPASAGGQINGKKEILVGWSTEELKAATGREDSTVVQHELKLCSAYSKIQAEPGSRDAVGEPFVTSFHQKFMGTVDYIWHTEGLRPLKVLDTLPTRVLQRTRGFPTQKWGSDHLALACEFDFIQRSLPSEGQFSNDVTTATDVDMPQAF